MKCPNCYFIGEPSYRREGDHLGAYCKRCGKWLTWLKKDTIPENLIETKKLNKPLFED